MKKLLLGMALTASLSSASYAVKPIVETPPPMEEEPTVEEQLFMIEGCFDFYTFSANEDELPLTMMKITGELLSNGDIRVTLDNTSTGGTNKPIATGIGFVGGQSYFMNITDSDLSGPGVAYEQDDNPGLNGGGFNFDADTDIGMENTNGVENGINPNNDLLLVDFKPIVSVADITDAFKKFEIPIRVHFQSYPDSGNSAKGLFTRCGGGEIPEPSRALFGLLGVMGSVFIRRRPRSKK